jgi:hypothetical protein
MIIRLSGRVTGPRRLIIIFGPVTGPGRLIVSLTKPDTDPRRLIVTSNI